MFSLLDLFVEDEQIYLYDESVVEVDRYLASSRLFFYFILLTTIVYLIVCGVYPIIFIFEDEASRELVIPLSGFYAFCGLFLTTFAGEYFLYGRVEEKVDHITNLVKITIGNGCFTHLVNCLKKYFFNNKIIYYKRALSLASLLVSQLYRFDFFINAIFTVACFRYSEATLGTISLIFILVTIFNIFQALVIIICNIQDWKHVKQSTSEINKYYNIASITAFEALSDILDKIAA